MEPLILDLKVDNAQAINSINAFFDVYEKGVDGMSKVLSDALGKDVEVGVQLKVEGDKIIAEGVEKVDKAVQKTEAAAKLMNKEFGKTPNELKLQFNLLKQLQGGTRKYAADGKTVTKEWQTVADMINKIVAKMREMNAVAGNGDLTNKLITSQIAADSLMGAFNMLTNAVLGFARTGAEMEVLFVQLRGFVGGAEEAAAAYQRFVEIGQSTPFTAKEVATAARTMMGFGIETNDASTQVERLAIVAGATGGELTHMARNMGQISANQRAYTRDLMQFANQGIPIYQELAEILGTNTQHVRELAEEGKIGFAEVSVALENMTQQGSAFAEIADLMDKTFSANMEAMFSAVENVAGSFMMMATAIDQATGGLASGVFKIAIRFLNDMAKGMQWVGRNAAILGPLIVGLTTATAAYIAVAINRHWTTIIGWMKGLQIATKIQTALDWAATVAATAKSTAMGDVTAALRVGAAAAGVAAIAALHVATAEQDVADAAVEAAQASAKKTAATTAEIFATEGLTMATADLVLKEQQRYDKAKKQLDIHKNRAQLAINYAKEEYEAWKKGHDQRMADLEEGWQAERDRHQSRKQEIKDEFDAAIEAQRELIAGIRERHSEENADLNARSAAETKLRDMRKAELEAKLKTLAAGSKEYLQTQVAIEAIDKQIAREKLRARQKAELKAEQEKLNKLESDKKSATDAEEGLHNTKKKNYKETKKLLQDENKAEKAKVEEAEALMEQFHSKKQQLQFESHQQAIQFINDEIAATNDLIKVMDDALAKAAQLQQASSGNAVVNMGAAEDQGTSLPTFFTGGPLGRGQAAQVNELGKEAFLTASGKLGMINAPAFGKWRAPEAGTVIPAHLTKQLDIPAGGINLNKVAGSTTGSVRTVSGARGDVFHQNVTVQATNPVQAANNLMVEMTRLRRRGLR